MEALLCRSARSFTSARASSHDLPIRDLENIPQSNSLKSPKTVSFRPGLTHSSLAEDRNSEQRSSPPPSLKASLPLPLSLLLPLPLPLPLPLQLPLFNPGSVFPSPLKFLWFHKEITLEKEPEGEIREIAIPLSLTSAPRLGEEEFTIAGEDSRVQKAGEQQSTNTSGYSDQNATDRGDSAKQGTEKSKSWVPNLVNLTYLWRKHSFDFQRGSVDQKAEESSSHIRVPGCCSDSGCEICGGDHYLQSEAKVKKFVMGFEIPVVHDKETFGEFLHLVQLPELKFVARMSYLANQAYYIPELKKDELFKHHRLRFITSSLERKAAMVAREKAALVAKEKLALSAENISRGTDSLDRIGDSSGKEDEKTGVSLGPAQATYALAATAASYLAYQTKSLLPFKSSHLDEQALKEGVEKLTLSIVEGDDSEKHINPQASEENEDISEAEKFASVKKSAPDVGTADILSEVKSLEDDMRNSEGSSGRLATASAIASTGLVAAEDETKDAVAQVLQSDAWCPSEWFVCDEEGTSTRYFVIQGSDSLASWQANLLFESSNFEDPEWGVMVHRGIYEAAKGLYEQLMPLIQAHLETHGDKAKFYFTGHSLGGSLATLLTLMLKHRGILPVSAIRPVYTFGSPSIMCGGDWLLEKLGFSSTHVQSVVMHYDIVPRTFACHYPDQVAEVLKRVNGTFRNLACLQQQKLMYAPMGQMMVLQPDHQQAPGHPFLPTGSALYQIKNPKQEGPSETDKGLHGVVKATAKEVRSAERSFLNTPHPLEILSDPSSYGTEGTISRDHDSRSYMRAVNTALKEEFKKWRRLDRDRRRQLWDPLTRTKSGKGLIRPLSDAITSVENGGIIAGREKLRRSISFNESEEHNTLNRESASDSQMEPLSRC